MFDKLFTKYAQAQNDLDTIDAFCGDKIVTQLNGLRYTLTPIGTPDNITNTDVCRWCIVGTSAHFEKILNSRERLRFLTNWPVYKAVYYANTIVWYHNFEIGNVWYWDAPPPDFSYVNVARVGNANFVVKAARSNRQHLSACQNALAALNQCPSGLPKAYQVAYHNALIGKRAEIEANRELTMAEKIEAALGYGNAVLVSQTKANNQWVVEYRIPDVSPTEVFRTTIDTDLNVITPGVCLRLNGEYDLQSLVPLIKVGRHEGRGDWGY